MTIHNQQLTDTRGLDLDAFIRRHGPPHYPTQRNPVGTLNERFWAAFLATFNELIYENREDQFYRYGGKIYIPTSEHLLREQLAMTSSSLPEPGPITRRWRSFAMLVT